MTHDRSQAEQPEQRHVSELRVQRRRAGSVRVQARRRRVRALRLSAHLQRPPARLAHVLGQGDRPRRQRGQRRRVQLDDRHDAADDRDHGQAGQPEQRQLADLLVHRERGRQQLRLQARRRCLRAVCLTEDLQRGRGRARTRSRSERPTPRRTPARAETYSWTIDTTAPTTSINQKPANPSNESSPSFAFTASESGESVRVSSRRRQLRALRLREELHGSRRRISHLRCPGHRPRRQSRGRDELHLGGRHRRSDGRRSPSSRATRPTTAHRASPSPRASSAAASSASSTAPRSKPCTLAAELPGPA